MSDATPAYRGYRLQTLYTLSRILESPEGSNLVFQPEGLEDFDVLGTDHRLLETVQVKAYDSRDLSLSTFKPAKPDSFLYRVWQSLRNHPDMKIVIASFGNVGPELWNATRGDERHRSSVSRKISDFGIISQSDAESLIDHIEIVPVVESELTEAVFTTLRSLLTGVDPDSAFDLLNFWLYKCAENKTKITQADVIQRINDVGQFTAERNAIHGEWFRSINLIIDNEVSSEEKVNLEGEFYRGISARYEHILAEVDKPREHKLEEISRKFKDNQVVIVHGASGQGKTTLAYRYLHDFFPEKWRFQIKLVANRQHALNIATALAGQASAIGIPVAVYLDVSPNDLGWDELVKQLTLYKDIRVLVTVREEDFRRASISGAEIQFAEIELKFERSEAEEIYKFLAQAETPERFIDFDDAWNRFGGNGPLMEFVYLVTQGNSLRERLLQQIRAIQDRARGNASLEAEIQLLRLVSVSSAYEARMKLSELIDYLQLPTPDRTLELLEKEYLLRTSEGGTLVGGLHPIRSAILTDILTDSTLYPWGKLAGISLNFIFEQDIGSFLLYAFLRPAFEIESLLSELDKYKPHRWIAVSGCIRALIWLGIKEYVEENQALILEAYETVHHAWSLALNFDIADASPGINDIWTSSLTSLTSEEWLAQANSFRSRQTHRERIFIRVSEWIVNLSQEPVNPQSDPDWIGLSESLFWKGRLQIDSPITDWLQQIDLSNIVESLSLEILADLLLGLFYADEATYQTFIDANYDTLLRRFRQEKQTLLWEDADQNIRAHFAIKLFQEEEHLSESSTDLRYTSDYFLNASMERLNLLRNFFPDREIFGIQGYGHLISAYSELPDATHKGIPRENYPLSKLTRLNATFTALGEKSLRPVTWGDYCQEVIQLRKTVLIVLEKLIEGLQAFFKEQERIMILDEHIRQERWDLLVQLLNRSPSFPQCAFDEWGFITEKNNRKSEVYSKDGVIHQNLALEKYEDYSQAFNGYIRILSNFVRQANYPLIFHPHIRVATTSGIENTIQQHRQSLEDSNRLSIINLADAWKLLPKFQSESRIFLVQFIDVQDLITLEEHERRIFKTAWCSWYLFASNPNYVIQNSIRECIQFFSREKREVKSLIQRALRRFPSDLLSLEILSEGTLWEGEKCLWIKIDGENPFEVYESIQPVAEAIREAINPAHNDPLRRYAIELTWSHIIFVPLVRGKSLDLTARKISSILFSTNSNREFSPWRFAPVDIPSNASSELCLQEWKNPRLIMAQKLIGLAFQLSILASHLKDFDRLSTLDEQGDQLLQEYLDQISPLFGEALMEFIKAEGEMIAYFNQLTSAQSENRSHLVSAMQMLPMLHEQVLPTDDCIYDEGLRAAMSFEDFITWSDRLSEAQSISFLIYLFWISDIMQEVENI